MKASFSILAAVALMGWGGLGQLWAGSPPVSGAEVDESRIEQTYYVDPAASEALGAEGTQEAPFKTLESAFKAAAHAKDAGHGVKILLADGIYRETASLSAPANGRPDTDAPLVIEAVNRQQAIIDGAKIAGWEAITWKHDGPNWTHEWPERAEPSVAAWRLAPGTPKPPNDVTQRAGLIFFNGVALRQVSTAQQVVAGSFYAPNPLLTPAVPRRGAKRANAIKQPIGSDAVVTLQPPDGTEAESAQIEVATESVYGFRIESRRNVVVRGLVFQHISHSAKDFPGALTFKDCANVLIEDVLCQWNSGPGVSIIGSAKAPWSGGVTLRRVQAINNGGSGMFISNVKDLLAEDCETSFNNFRGDWSGWIDPAGPAGCKVSGIHGGTWRRHHAVGNWCRGMNWNGDCTDITLEDSTLRNNLVSGLFIENCPGPVAVRRCIIDGTKSHPSVRDGSAYPAAVSICATPDVTLESCIVSSNAMPQLGLWDIAQRADGINFETKAKETNRAERHVYRHNVFSGLDAEQLLFSLPTADHAGKGTFDFFYNTLSSNENCFWNPVRADVFCTCDKAAYAKPGMGFEDWRAFLAARATVGKPPPEADSIWRDPLLMDPAEGDFRLKAASPVLDWNLPSDERVSE